MDASVDLRLHLRNERPEQPAGRYVLYWMRATRRTTWNYALDRAVARAADLGAPLLVLEDLRLDDPWASLRRHRFVLDGMTDTARRLRDRPVRYYPYVEPSRGRGDGLVEALAADACLVVTDTFPDRASRRQVARVAGRIACRLEEVDSCGLLPLLAADRVFTTAFAFRRFLQKHLPEHLAAPPRTDPLARARLRPLRGLPREITRRWPPATAALLAGEPHALASLAADSAIPPAPIRGGPTTARVALRQFLDKHLAHYVDGRNHPDADTTSGLAPYLHFGHIAPHEVLAAIAAREGGWSPDRLAPRASGHREGWWGMSPGAEAFLDQLVTWREVGYNFASRRDDYDAYASLPPWALRTLADYARDVRPYRYGRARLEAAHTHDRLWNAAQTQLVREGRLHNYLRMLWGKKILEWSASPESALDVMIDLNNRYALDGCDPNSYAGILWVLGRYDRPWGPRRPVFGTVRYMSSANTQRKVRVKAYLDRYAPAPARLHS